MTRTPFEHLENLFNITFAQPRERWAEVLAEHEPDAEVRATVLRMLDHTGEQGEDPFGSHLTRIVQETIATRVPEAIGPYRILELLGEGGMGTVYLAERRLDTTGQRVALKLLRGIPTPSGRRRMARERDLLAGLNHPRIAQLIDGGETEQGQPYLVMAFVEGRALQDFLAEGQAPLPDRLRLFTQCCDAVQHAHQRLILHRDIKPSNIVVGADGTPVLLDFGVGTLLEEGQAEAQTATHAFTPGYGAPEQIHGGVATTATDVFGLGALLFDLLADTRLSTLRRGDAPVPAPSAHIADAGRKRAVRGDLDRIVAKATAQAPEARYRSVALLSDDVQRFLRGQPIQAGPDAVGYRLRKFVARHRWAVAAGVAIALMAGGFVWQLNLERRRALEAQQAAVEAARRAEASRDFLASLLVAGDPDALEGRQLTPYALLGAMEQRLRNERTVDPITRVIAWLTLSEVYRSLGGKPELSLRAADMAAAMLAQAGATQSPFMARVQRIRGATLLQLGRHAQARQAYRDLIASPDLQQAGPMERARAYYGYANAAAAGGDWQDAQAHHAEVLEALGADRSAAAARLRFNALLALADIRLRLMDVAGAAQYATQARSIAPALPAGDAGRQALARLEAELQAAGLPAAGTR